MPTFADFDFTPEPHQIEQIYASGFKGVLNEGRLSHAAFRGASPRLYDLYPQARGIHQDVEVCLPIRAVQAVCGQDFCAASGEAQKQGDCVGKNVKGMGLIDGCIDHLFGETSWVKDSNGVGVLYCDENHYGDRGHGGEGADCWRLWNNASLDGRQGFLFRQVYDVGGKTYDLSKYRSDLSGPWGRSGTPDDLSAIADKNPALEVMKVKSTEELMDGLVLGMGGGRCGGQGYGSNRNEDGLSERSGGWNHAISIGGFIRTKAIVERYSGVIFLYFHFWGGWNSGPNPYEIPNGSWFVRQKEVDACIRSGECALLGNVVGVDRKLRWEKLMDRRSWLEQEGYLKAA